MNFSILEMLKKGIIKKISSEGGKRKQNVIFCKKKTNKVIERKDQEN